MKITICDDEKEIRELIKGYICSLYPDSTITQYISGEELLENDSLSDIIFLDIQMDGIDGMEVARILRKRNIKSIIIFVTAIEEYVFQAFDVGAFHYLIKPFDKAKFFSVLKAAVQQYKEGSNRIHNEEKYIMIKTGRIHTKVYVNEIIYAEVYILLMFASTAYCFYRLCIPFFDRDKKVWLAGLTYFVVMVGLYYMPMKIGNFLAYSIGVIAALLVMCLMDQKNIAKKGFLAITFFAVRWLGLSMVGYLYDLAYTPVGNIIKILLDYNETEIWKVYLGIFIGMNMIKLVMGFFFIWIPILIIQKTFTYKKDKMTIKEMSMLSIPSVSGMMGYAILLSYNHMFNIYNQHYWLWFFNNMISIVAIIVVIVLFQDLKQKTKEERKNFILSNQIMDIQAHIEELEHLYRNSLY